MAGSPSGIQQRRWLTGRLELAFEDGDRLRCRTRFGGEARDFTMSLSGLGTEVAHLRKLSAGGLAGTLVLGLTTLGCLIGVWTSEPDAGNGPIWAVCAVLAAVPTLLCAWKLYRDSYHVTVVSGEGGSITLMRNRPDRGSYDAFLEELLRRIRCARQQLEETCPDGLGVAREIERLARLRADGALSDDEFAAAKHALIATIGRPEPIGFR